MLREIEPVQRRFTKPLNAFYNLECKELLLNLQTESMEFRRLRSDLVVIRRISNKNITLNSADFFVRS